MSARYAALAIWPSTRLTRYGAAVLNYKGLREVKLPISRICFFAAALLVLVPNATAGPLTQLTMHSDLGDFIGQGRDYFFDLTNVTSFRAYSYDYNLDGHPNIVFFQILTPTTFWLLYFGTDGLGHEISPGHYIATGIGAAGSAYLWVGGDGRGDSNTTGEFTVLESYFPFVSHASEVPPGSSFAATFRQLCCGVPLGQGSLYGTIYFNYDAAAAIPEPGGFLLTLAGLAALVGHRARVSIWRPSEPPAVKGLACRAVTR